MSSQRTSPYIGLSCLVPTLCSSHLQLKLPFTCNPSCNSLCNFQRRYSAAMGRGAPHHVRVPASAVAQQAGLDDEAILDHVTKHFFDIRASTVDLKRRQANVAQRWRLGIAFATLHEGELLDHNDALPCLASGAAPICCPLVGIWSDADELWKPADCALWEDLVNTEAAAAAPGQQPTTFSEVLLHGVPHLELVQSAEMSTAIFSTLSQYAAQLASSSTS